VEIVAGTQNHALSSQDAPI